MPKSKAAKPVRAEWELKLYVAGQTPKSLLAFANLKRICEEHIAEKYHIEVVDLLKNPTLARGDQFRSILKHISHRGAEYAFALFGDARLLIPLERLFPVPFGLEFAWCPIAPNILAYSFRKLHSVTDLASRRDLDAAPPGVESVIRPLDF